MSEQPTTLFTIYLDEVIIDKNERMEAARKLAKDLRVDDVERVYKLISKAPKKVSKALPKNNAKKLARMYHDAGLKIKVKKKLVDTADTPAKAKQSPSASDKDARALQKSNARGLGTQGNIGRGSTKSKDVNNYDDYYNKNVPDYNPYTDNPYIRKSTEPKQGIKNTSPHDESQIFANAVGAHTLPKPTGTGLFSIPPITELSLKGIRNSAYIQAITNPAKVFWNLHNDYPNNIGTIIIWWFAFFVAVISFLVSFITDPSIKSLVVSLFSAVITFFSTWGGVYVNSYMNQWLGYTFFSGKGNLRDLMIGSAVNLIASSVLLILILPIIFLLIFISPNSVVWGIGLSVLALTIGFRILAIAIRNIKEAHRFSNWGAAIGTWFISSIAMSIVRFFLRFTGIF